MESSLYSQQSKDDALHLVELCPALPLLVVHKSCKLLLRGQFSVELDSCHLNK